MEIHRPLSMKTFYVFKINELITLQISLYRRSVFICKRRLRIKRHHYIKYMTHITKPSNVYAVRCAKLFFPLVSAMAFVRHYYHHEVECNACILCVSEISKLIF